MASRVERAQEYTFLLYTGPGADDTCVRATSQALGKFGRVVLCESAKKMQEQITEAQGRWDRVVCCLPGGQAGPMMTAFDGEWGPIQEAAQKGMRFLGICAGAIVGGTRCVFQHKDRENEDSGWRLGGVLPHTSQAPVLGTGPDGKVLVFQSAEGQDFPSYAKDGPIFSQTEGCRVLATHQGNPVAVVKGNAAALAFHPEFTTNWETRLPTREDLGVFAAVFDALKMDPSLYPK